MSKLFKRFDEPQKLAITFKPEERTGVPLSSVPLNVPFLRHGAVCLRVELHLSQTGTNGPVIERPEGRVSIVNLVTGRVWYADADTPVEYISVSMLVRTDHDD